ncbi:MULTISPECIES: ABC transporter ATP-binding protein [Rhizobium/Agrobacterium group]|uniref:ABC transporter ATP-binding protein n=1 Tax=Rhizobium/Agrobacterium group TaxID=227290 RepID=UPI000B405E5E|nr:MULTISPECIES: ATP-binding cassette domain-containing protein [Rhizobium/Agrobacterium group]MCF1483416.1 ATP-binding cassette domain-containing protein [Allorhizobium ampelinum]NSZ41627.1 ATP-binding cassette domain-containing protein [Agrobacterium vitis]NTA25310.1 ATP-binding cassette domain-containing protein [Allorhizobium ampelinum]OVE97436.1 ABC transporter [Allorhizobium ampelinum]
MMSLVLEDVAVRYAGLAKPVLNIGRLEVAAGAQLAIIGGSGSGKSTLVNVMTGLERLRQGNARWNGTDLSGLSEGARDRFRAAHIGLVMQEFHLFSGLSAIDNILLPARLARVGTPACVKRAHDLMQRFGLGRPDQAIETMSRGEMQRVAVARALLRKPGVIIADEPTASLDAEAGAAVADLLLDLAKSEGSTLIVVSHDARLVERLPRRIELKNGEIVHDTGDFVGHQAGPREGDA